MREFVAIEFTGYLILVFTGSLLKRSLRRSIEGNEDDESDEKSEINQHVESQDGVLDASSL